MYGFLKTPCLKRKTKHEFRVCVYIKQYTLLINQIKSSPVVDLTNINPKSHHMLAKI